VIRAVVFDFDGVVLESVDIKTTAFRRLAAPHGDDAARRLVDYHLEHGGISRFEKLRWFHREVLGSELSDERCAQLGDEFSALVLDEVLRCAFVPGARELLDRLAADGAALFVASGTPEDELRDIVARRGLEGCFRGVYGSPARKAQIVRRILGAEGLEADEVLFVGDAMTDHHGAREAGVPFVGRVPAGEPSPFPDGTLVVTDMAELGVLWPQLAAAPPVPA
jgi:phosphoglycolate phosphatase-like HAD superfamily hydrolase